VHRSSSAYTHDRQWVRMRLAAADTALQAEQAQQREEQRIREALLVDAPHAPAPLRRLCLVTAHTHDRSLASRRTNGHGLCVNVFASASAFSSTRERGVVQRGVVRHAKCVYACVLPYCARCCKQAEAEKQAAGAAVAKDIADHTQAAAAAQKAVDEALEKLEVEKRLAAERQRQLERKQVRTSRTRAHTQAHTHTHTCTRARARGCDSA
jgi:hypothetical protein